MKVKILEEAGYESALRGMAYSYRDRATCVETWWQSQKERAMNRAHRLAPMEGGHNKFLESIQVWVDIEASRAFWSEFDTYRVGVSKNSESTMHTLAKRPPTVDDFEVGTPKSAIDIFISLWPLIKEDIVELKQALPEGFLQRRIVSTNYKTLRNICKQRRGHRYKWWDVFISEITSQIQHKELLN